MGELDVARTGGAGAQGVTAPKGPSQVQQAAPGVAGVTAPAGDTSTARAPRTGAVPAMGGLEGDDLSAAQQARSQGLAAYRQGNFRAAEGHFRKSVELYTKVASAGNAAPKVMVDWIATISDLGRTIYNVKDVPAEQRQKNMEVVSALYQQASEAFKELAALPELKGYGQLYAGIMGLNLNVALAYQEQGQPDEAEKLLKINLSLAGKLSGMKELGLSVSQTHLNLALVYASKGETARVAGDNAGARVQFRAAQNVLGQAEAQIKAAGGGADWNVHAAVVHQRQAFLALRLAQLDGNASAKGQEGLKESRRLADQALAEFRQAGHAEGVKATQALIGQIK